jgi:hypothetical protein
MSDRLRRFGRSKMLPMYFASAFVEKQAKDEAASGRHEARGTPV